jgi:hypothetical protein
VSGTLQKNFSFEVTQSVHCFKMMVLEATQSLQSLIVQDFQATQSLHKCKNDGFGEKKSQNR